MATQIQRLIQARKRTVGNRRVVRRTPVPIPPRAAEVRFRKYLFGKIAKVRDLFRDFFRPVAREAIERQVRADAPVDDVRAEMARLKRLVDEEFGEDLDRIMSGIAVEVNQQNKGQFEKIIGAAVGARPFLDEGLLEDDVRFFVSQNASLIRTIPNRFFDRVEQIVFNDFRQGLRHEETWAKIQDEFGKMTSNARTIARDQIQKLNGQLTQHRQQAIGIDRYIWRTARDERVRPLHEEREGEVFTWDDPPEDGHPGEAINCRCYAQPVFDLDAIGNKTSGTDDVEELQEQGAI